MSRRRFDKGKQHKTTFTREPECWRKRLRQQSPFWKALGEEKGVANTYHPNIL